MNPPSPPKTPYEEMVYDMYEKVTQIHTALYGIPNTEEKGMCGSFIALKQDFKDFREKDYNKFKGNVIKVFAFVLGTGALTGAGIGLDKLITWLT